MRPGSGRRVLPDSVLDGLEGLGEAAFHAGLFQQRVHSEGLGRGEVAGAGSVDVAAGPGGFLQRALGCLGFASEGGQVVCEFESFRHVGIVRAGADRAL